MAKLVTKTYGKALLDLAVEENKVDELFEEAKAIRQILSKNRDLNLLMTHPKISRQDKFDVISAIFQNRVSNEMLGFLNILVEKERFRDLEGIIDFFLDEVKEIKGIGVATVTSAYPLNVVEQKRIEEKLLATTGYQSIEIHYEVEQTLIGGMIIRMKDRVIDGSVQTKISEMKKQLLKIQL